MKARGIFIGGSGHHRSPVTSGASVVARHQHPVHRHYSEWTFRQSGHWELKDRALLRRNLGNSACKSAATITSPSSSSSSTTTTTTTSTCLEPLQRKITTRYCKLNGSSLENGLHEYNRDITPPIRTVLSFSSSSYLSASSGGGVPPQRTFSTITQFDFFGEPVTFRQNERTTGSMPATTTTTSHTTTTTTTNTTTTTKNNTISPAMAAFNSFLLVTVTKGRSCYEGGDEAGLAMKGAHGAAVVWSELLRHARQWDCNAPLLSVAAIAPLWIQTGGAYIQHMDQLLSKTKTIPGLPKIQLYDMANRSIQLLLDQDQPPGMPTPSTAGSSDDVPPSPPLTLTTREIYLLQMLRSLVQYNDLSTALATIMEWLQQSPGDVFSLALALEMAQMLGDKESARRVSGSVASYWNERRGGIITPALTGHSIASAWVALGLAVGGYGETVMPMLERCMRDSNASAVAVWAQAHVFDSAGRVSEGISACANHDGIVKYEGAGWLFHDCRLAGYGARFSIDREERGRGQSAALRLYDAHFDRVLEYSGFSRAQAWETPVLRAPLPWVDNKSKWLLEGDGEKVESFWEKLFPSKKKKKEREEAEEVLKELILYEGRVPSTRLHNFEPTMEDVLTWLPPTPLLLTDATLLLLRLTFNGTISRRNIRWDCIRNAWQAWFAIEDKFESKACVSPIAEVVASLLLNPAITKGDRIGNGKLAAALHRMGESLQLGTSPAGEATTKEIREVIADLEPDLWLPVESNQNVWKEIVKDFWAGIQGMQSVSETTTIATRKLRFEAWDFDARPIISHAVVFAACKAGDVESLSLARAICSEGVTLRQSSPEEWWRYSIVLGLLGDSVGAEDALERSINCGGGQGSRH